MSISLWPGSYADDRNDAILSGVSAAPANGTQDRRFRLIIT